MLSAEQSIRAFLYDVVGYGKLREVVAATDPKECCRSGFLEGTLIGTGDRLKAPTPSYIRSSQELAEKVNVCNTLIVNDLPYHILNRSYFKSSRDLGAEKVGVFLDERIMPVVGGQHSFDRGPKKSHCWVHKIQAEDFRLRIAGSLPHNTKTLTVDFRTAPEIVADINTYVKEYYSLRSKRKSRSTLK